MEEFTVSTAMDWNAVLEDDSDGTLEENDYLFRVVGLERGRYGGSAKLPSCWQATVSLELLAGERKVPYTVAFQLCQQMEWKLSSFFRSIGLKKRGERLVMDWSKVVNARGKCHIRPTSYRDKNGNLRTGTEISQFLDYDPADWNEPDWLHDAQLELPMEPLTGGF